jgi:hypothetical protein
VLRQNEVAITGRRPCKIIADRRQVLSVIRGDLGAIFISLELSLSTWLITSAVARRRREDVEALCAGRDVCVLLRLLGD